MIAIAFAAHLLFLGVMAFVGEFSVRPDSPEAYTVEVVSDGELGGHMPAGLPKLDLGGQAAPKQQLAKQAPPPRQPPAEPKAPPQPEPEKAPQPEQPPEPPPPPAKAEPETSQEAPKPEPPADAKPPEEGDLIVATATPTARPTGRPTPKPTAAPTASPRPTAKPTPKPSASPRPSATPAATEAAVKPPRPSPGRSPGPAPKPTLSPPVLVRPQVTPSAQRASGVAEAQRSPHPGPTSASEARIAAALERVQRKVGEQKDGGAAAGGAADAGVRAPSADARGSGGVGGTDAPDPNRRIGIGPGRGGAGELRGVEFLLYYNRMLARIRETWVYTGSATNVEVEVQFRVLDDGVVSDLRVKQPSGDPSYDDSVLRAVRAASPLGPPPEKYRADFSDVVLTFRPGDLKKAP